jgi:hypothetical protein
MKPDEMPTAIKYDEKTTSLLVGTGIITNVTPEIWAYEVSGKQVIRQWFSYRGANRERPVMGDRRSPSPLCDIQPDHWLAEYTEELIDLINVIGCLIDLESKQCSLLDRVCSGRTIGFDELECAGALAVDGYPTKPTSIGQADDTGQTTLSFGTTGH